MEYHGFFRVNQSVITSAMIPKSTLNKRHNALSYHRVREQCIDMGIINLLHLDGKSNPMNVPKFLRYSKLHPLLQPLLLWKGETMVNDSKPILVVICSLSNDTPSGLRGLTNNNNPSGV